MNNLTKILGTGILALGISGGVFAENKKNYELAITKMGAYGTQLQPYGDSSPSITAADLDGDGDMDLILTYQSRGGNIQILTMENKIPQKNKDYQNQ